MKRASWNSPCPVTRRGHEWVYAESYGPSGALAFCSRCKCNWIGAEEEWRLYKDGADWLLEHDSWVKTKHAGGPGCIEVKKPDDEDTKIGGTD